MAREDSGSSSGGSLTSDEEGFENIPEGLAPTYHTEGVAPTYRTAAPDIPSPTGRPSMDRRSQRPPHSPAHPPLGPHARRFKAIAQKVIHLHRTSKPHGAGAEPGIDPRRSSAHQLYGHLTQLCTISVIDYNAVSARFREFDNAGLRTWFRGKDHARPAWARVRWIHVNAISWDVLSMLALEYELHPLALEDVLHSRSSSRSKASYYSTQLFIRVLCHTLSNEDPHAPKGSIIPEIPRSESPVEDLSEKGDPDATLGKNSQGTTLVSRNSGERWQNRDADVGRLARQAKLQVLREQDHRVLVDLYNLFIFLMRDGTVITIHAEPGSTLFDPIKERLRARDTILRRTADPSLLVESVLDLVVDEGLDIVDRYQETLGKLEAAILGRPKMRLVRALHVIAADLALLKRSLDPVKSLIFGLRRYDLDRCIAVAHSVHQDQHPQQDVKEQVPVVGFMSHKAKIYLADVYDHIEYVLGSMDLFSVQAENLISYTFNMSGYQTNETMRRLTLVTIICLPLTLLTGYFGQNFQPFPAVEQHSDILFWEIALPMMAFLIPLFLWSDITRGVHKVQKLMAAKRASKEVKAAIPISKNKYHKKQSGV